MDLEQLKLVLDAAGAAGEGAFWIAIWYIGTIYFTALTILAGLIGSGWIINIAIRIVSAEGTGIRELERQIRRSGLHDGHFRLDRSTHRGWLYKRLGIEDDE